MTTAIEIEVAGPDARQLFFDPIQRVLRGRADFSAAKSKSALSLRDDWPEPVPGKIIGVHPDTGERYIREPLHEKQHTRLVQKIMAKKLALEDEREVFISDDETTWLYWMRRAVDAGHARIVSGDLPKIEFFADKKPRKDFIFAQQDPANDPVIAAMNRMADVVEQNNKLLVGLLQALAAKAGK